MGFQNETEIYLKIVLLNKLLILYLHPPTPALGGIRRAKPSNLMTW